MPPRSPPARPFLAPPPVVFTVGGHELRLSLVSPGRWTVAVDGTSTDQSFRTRVEAWEAGVRAADAQDRLRGPTP